MGLLTDKNKEFAREYISNHYNGTQAYLKVYECSYENAVRKAWALVRKPEVQEYIKELQKERVEALNISADRLLEELAQMAFAEKGDEDYPANIKVRALDLLQKQMGLQSQKLEANVNQETTIVVDIEEEE